MNLKDKKVLVVGSGKSGIAAVGLLHAMQALPVLFDSNEQLTTMQLKEKLQDNVTECYIGSIPAEVEDKIEVVVLSPGVPVDIPFVEAFRQRNIPIIGEIELGYLYEKGRVIAITGTNGKTKKVNGGAS